MTWVVTAPTSDTEADERVHATAALAVVAVDTLQVTADLAAALLEGKPDDEEGTLKAEVDRRVAQLLQLRDSLIETFKIHKERLPKTVTDDLRDGFRLANLGADDQADARKKLCEEVVDHPVDALAELNPDEAKAIRARLTEMEPKF